MRINRRTKWNPDGIWNWYQLNDEERAIVRANVKRIVGDDDLTPTDPFEPFREDDVWFKDPMLQAYWEIKEGPRYLFAGYNKMCDQLDAE